MSDESMTARVRLAARDQYANRVNGAAFDRWYAAEKAKWQAEALRGFHDALVAVADGGHAAGVDDGILFAARQAWHNANRIERGE